MKDLNCIGLFIHASQLSGSTSPSAHQIKKGPSSNGQTVADSCQQIPISDFDRIRSKGEIIRCSKAPLSAVAPLVVMFLSEPLRGPGVALDLLFFYAGDTNVM